MVNVQNKEILGYDCDGNEIYEFRILRFPFSADVENWDEEPNVDPRFYCLVKSEKGEVFAVSVYDDWVHRYIRRYEGLSEHEDAPMLIKTVSDMANYEVAYIENTEWYYDRNKNELRKKLDRILKEQTGFVKKIHV